MKKTIIVLILLIPLFTNAQSLNKELESNDIRAALKMLGIETYKYVFDSTQNNYNLIVHLDQFVKDSIIIQKSYYMGKWKQETKPKQLKIISKISSDTTGTYWYNIIHPNMEVVVRFDIPAKFRKAHYCKQIKQGKIAYNQKTPLLFYGMAWEDEINGMKILRFCWGDEVERDMRNETLKKIEHKILISYELVK